MQRPQLLQRFLATACFLILAAPAHACVGCRTPGESLGDASRTVQAGLAFSWSVLFLLTVIFGFGAFLAFYIAKACRQADRKPQRVPIRRK